MNWQADEVLNDEDYKFCILLNIACSQGIAGEEVRKEEATDFYLKCVCLVLVSLAIRKK